LMVPHVRSAAFAHRCETARYACPNLWNTQGARDLGSFNRVGLCWAAFVSSGWHRFSFSLPCLPPSLLHDRTSPNTTSLGSTMFVSKLPCLPLPCNALLLVSLPSLVLLALPPILLPPPCRRHPPEQSGPLELEP